MVEWCQGIVSLASKGSKDSLRGRGWNRFQPNLHPLALGGMINRHFRVFHGPDQGSQALAMGEITGLRSTCEMNYEIVSG
jgi:hypothetical protein